MHISCGKINRLRLMYHGFGVFTIERWRGRVVGEGFCVVGERLLKVEAKVGKILHINLEKGGEKL